MTELNWHGLVFDELTNGQAIMPHSRGHLTASVIYVTTLTYVTVLMYVSTNDQWARCACLLDNIEVGQVSLSSSDMLRFGLSQHF